jgi:hypothetical protein
MPGDPVFSNDPGSDTGRRLFTLLPCRYAEHDALALGESIARALA